MPDGRHGGLGVGLEGGLKGGSSAKGGSSPSSGTRGIITAALIRRPCCSFCVSISIAETMGDPPHPEAFGEEVTETPAKLGLLLLIDCEPPLLRRIRFFPAVERGLLACITIFRTDHAALVNVDELLYALTCLS